METPYKNWRLSKTNSYTKNPGQLRPSGKFDKCKYIYTSIDICTDKAYLLPYVKTYANHDFFFKLFHCHDETLFIRIELQVIADSVYYILSI